MRHVFEFRGTVAMGGSGKAYVTPVRELPTWRGGSAEFTFCDMSPDGVPGDTLCLEGDMHSLRTLFEQGLDSLDMLERYERGQVVAKAEASRQCEVCRCWYAPGASPYSHPDGSGGHCVAREVVG